MMASRMIISGSGSGSGRDEVYVAAVRLRASKPPAKLLFSTAYSLNLWQFHHFIVIINSHPQVAAAAAVAYDFQPRDPENIWVALAALSGRKVAGVIVERKLRVVPTRKCWFVGYAKEKSSSRASEFNTNWETHLRIGHHDCRHYSQALVQFLTGNQLVLDNLIRS